MPALLSGVAPTKWRATRFAHAYLDALLLVGESAWHASLNVELNHRPQMLSARFVPRARRWVVTDGVGEEE